MGYSDVTQGGDPELQGILLLRRYVHAAIVVQGIVEWHADVAVAAVGEEWFPVAAAAFLPEDGIAEPFGKEEGVFPLHDSIVFAIGADEADEELAEGFCKALSGDRRVAEGCFEETLVAGVALQPVQDLSNGFAHLVGGGEGRQRLQVEVVDA